MAEVLHGNANADQLNARNDKSQVYGLKGNDTLTSDGKSNVLLIGGAGDDTLIMSGGNGTLSGGKGSDTFELTYSATKKLSAIIEDLDPANDKIIVNFGGTSAPQLSSSISGNDVVWSDGDGLFNVTLKGIRENDYFDGDASDEAWEILKLTNAEREKENLPALTMSDGLTKAAEIRVQEIAELGEQGQLDIFKHDRPESLGGYSTVFDEVGKHYSAHAENITAGESTAAQAVADWMDSPVHKKNILDEENRSYSKLGVGYKYFDSGSLSSQGYYWEQLFGSSLYSPAPETVDVSTAMLEVHNVSTAVTLTEGNDNYSNSVFGATIAALGGNDSITNSGFNVSINGGADNDTVDNRGSFATINAGTGNDSIRLGSTAQGILIQYAAGDGSDTVNGFDLSDTLSISGDEFTPATVGNNVVVAVGDDSITLIDAAQIDTLNIDGRQGNLIRGTERADNITNIVDGKIIAALGGNDTIQNSGSNVSINAGTGDDSIDSRGNNVVFFHEGGNDTISGFYSSDTLKVAGGNYSSVTSGNDLILRSSADSIKLLGAAYSTINIADAEGSPVTLGNAKDIRGTENADSISNDLDGATIRAFGGDDTINNNGKQNTLYIYDSGNDIIEGFNYLDSLNIGDYAWEIVQNNQDVIVNIISDSATVGTVTLKDYSSAQVNIVSTYVPSAVQGEEISNDEEAVSVIGTAGDDTITNGGYMAVMYDVTIAGLEGNDSIHNYWCNNVSIDAGKGNDSVIVDGGHNVTVNGGEGNDYFQYDWGAGIAYVYTGGNDTINGFNGLVTLVITDNYSMRYINDDDNLNTVVINVENKGTLTLANYGYDEVNIVSSLADVKHYNIILDTADNNTTVNGTNGDDYIYTEKTNVRMNALAGGDYIDNNGDSATIDCGAGDDYVNNLSGGVNASILGGAGNDLINNNSNSSNVTIAGGADNDTVNNNGSNVLIDGGTGSDWLFNDLGDYVSIDGGAGDDYIYNRGASVSISGGDGNDYVTNEVVSTWNSTTQQDEVVSSPDNATIDGGAGNDVINNAGANVSINGGAGDDAISNGGASVTIDGGAGSDTIYNNGGDSVSVSGGAGNDRISLSSDSRNNFVRYANGDGNDTVWGMTENDTLNFLADVSLVSPAIRDGEDLIITVGAGSVRLIGAWNKPPHITYGESGTEGGGSNSGNNGGTGGSSGGTGGGQGGGGSGTSGGTSSGEGRGSDASGGTSASGRGGSGSSSGISGGGGTVSRRVRRYGNNTTSTTADEARKLYNALLSTAQEMQPISLPAAAQHVYTGGNQVISNYQSGDKIIFGAQYTGAFFDGAGNFIAGSSTGALAIENAMDKVIDLSDAAGNAFVKAYAATTAGVIDGRGIVGFELINGSAGLDVIFAGDGGSQLWGGADVAADALFGGGGADIFIGGRTQGADVFLNASSADIVHLNDATLSDIVATAEDNGVVAVAFNTGNVISVQSTEALSSAFVLADGLAYRYNHANKTWQNA